MRNHVIEHIGIGAPDQGRRRRAQRPLRRAAVVGPAAVRRGRAPATRRRSSSGPARCAPRDCTLAATAEQLRDEMPEAEHITKDTLASLLRRDADEADRRRASPPVSIGGRSTTSTRSCTAPSRTLSAGVGSLRNPADAADPPRAGQKSDGVHAWDAPTLRAVPRRVPRRRATGYHALWVLLATTGMRRGEALGLRWSDVDLDAGRARIVQTIIQTRSIVSVGEPKTARGRRPISLDPATVAVLRDAPPPDAAGATARRPRLRRSRPRVPPARRQLAPARRRERGLPPPGSPLRPPAPHAARACATPGRRSRSSRASTRGSSRSASATRRSPSRSASTATSRRRCTTRRPQLVAGLVLQHRVSALSDGRISGRVELRPIRLGLVVAAESADSLDRAIKVASLCWGGRTFPIFNVGEEQARVRRLAILLGVDALVAGDDDARSHELADMNGFSWMGYRNPVDFAEYGDRLVDVATVLSGVQGGTRAGRPDACHLGDQRRTRLPASCALRPHR